MGNSCYEAFHAFVAANRLIDQGDHVLVALSGGADSVALLRLLLRYREQEDAMLRISACHLNHGIRSDAGRDAIFCRELCVALDVPFVEGTADVPAHAADAGIGIEEAARNVRYAFLLRAAEEHRARVVATAHHADDNAETVWMRVARGTGVRGLAGIPVRRPLVRGSDVMLIRPLLSQRAEALRGFLRGEAQTWCEDHTNRDTAYARNRVRHDVLPVLDEWFGGDAVGPLSRLASAARAVDAFARERVEAQLECGEVRYQRGRVTFNADWFAALAPLLRSEAACELLRRLGAPMGEIASSNIESLLALSEEGGAVSLPGLEATFSGGRIELRLAKAEAAEVQGVELACPGETLLPEPFGGSVLVEPYTGAVDASPTVEVLDQDALAPPLFVRAWEEGDRFRPLGAPGTRKLQDVFTDAGVPSFERARTPLVCDGDGIVWVVGVRIADRVKVTPETTRRVRLIRRPSV